MTFKEINQAYLVPLAQWTMIFGIVALCQPWSSLLHRYGLTITLIGLVGFLIVMHIPPEPEADHGDADDDDGIDGPIDMLEINGNAPDTGPDNRSGIV
ncbi:hypothetical protein [Oceanomicrobium pacificus]|uniref:hypothetical protein n=1 Tax=Oceanomicrobium pacificus TaxID=2692916 RepID=UPI001967B3FD|nr:hypothetical protein [Oceanomicrobium pacificus]